MKVFAILILFLFQTVYGFTIYSNNNCSQRGSDLCCHDVEKRCINCNVNQHASSFSWNAAVLPVEVKQIVLWIDYHNVKNDFFIFIEGRKDQIVYINEMLLEDDIQSVHIAVEVKNFKSILYNGLQTKPQKGDFAEEYEYERKFIFDNITYVNFNPSNRYMSSWTSFTFRNKKCPKLQRVWPDLEELVFERSYITKLEPDEINLNNVERISFKNCTIEWFYNDQDFKRKAVFEGGIIEKIFGYAFEIPELQFEIKLNDSIKNFNASSIERLQNKEEFFNVQTVAVLVCFTIILIILSIAAVIRFIKKFNQMGSLELNFQQPEDIKSTKDETFNVESVTYKFEEVV